MNKERHLEIGRILLKLAKEQGYNKNLSFEQKAKLRLKAIATLKSDCPGLEAELNEWLSTSFKERGR